jgi:hypothetical protein
VIPGEIITPDGTVELSPGRDRVTQTVENADDRPLPTPQPQLPRPMFGVLADDAARAMSQLSGLCARARGGNPFAPGSSGSLR